MQEDRQFAVDAAIEGVRVRRVACFNGHAIYDPPTVAGRGIWQPTGRGRLCRVCQEPLRKGDGSRYHRRCRQSGHERREAKRLLKRTA